MYYLWYEKMKGAHGHEAIFPRQAVLSLISVDDQDIPPSTVIECPLHQRCKDMGTVRRQAELLPSRSYGGGTGEYSSV